MICVIAMARARRTVPRVVVAVLEHSIMRERAQQLERARSLSCLLEGYLCLLEAVLCLA